MRKNNPPGGQPGGLDRLKRLGTKHPEPSKFPAQKPIQKPQKPAQNPAKKPVPPSISRPPYEPTAPRITRGREWEDYDRRERDSDAELLASELNHELAKAFNDAWKEVESLEWLGSIRMFSDWYWCCHAELFELLDTVFLLMNEMGVTSDEAQAVAGATRKHFGRAMERWRTHHLELLDEEISLREKAEAEGGWLIPGTSWALFGGDSEPARKVKPARKAEAKPAPAWPPPKPPTANKETKRKQKPRSWFR
jgi:hypothetical protein